MTLSRSTLGQWVGECGVALQPLVDALKTHILRSSVLHADESPVQMLRPARQDGDKGHGQGHTQRAYCWAYCRPHQRWFPTSNFHIQF